MKNLGPYKSSILLGVAIFTLILTCFVIFVWSFVPPNSGAYYNPNTGHINCNSRAECLHEVGHKVDHSLGWVSQTPQFDQTVTVQTYKDWIYPELRSEFSEWLNFFPGVRKIKQADNRIWASAYWEGGWGDYYELYASMVAWCNGDIRLLPEGFQLYFQQDHIEAEMKGLGY